MAVARFAPTASGRAHPGTLLAGLIAWLDARARGARLVLRLEDLDPERCRATWADLLIDDLAWFGLTFDAIERQSDHAAAHAAALDLLERAGRLYPSRLSRRDLAAAGRRAPDGGWAYDNRERGAPLPHGGWRACDQPLRLRLDDGLIMIDDRGCGRVEQNPALAGGDPVVRRRDGVVSYLLAAVVDDGRLGVDRIVRGRDLLPGTPTQIAVQRLLGLPTPAYHHHLLVLEADGSGKLSKSHGAIDAGALRTAHGPAELCGLLAAAAGLLPVPRPVAPADLLPAYDPGRLARDDVCVVWQPAGLHLLR